ncbi:MAG: Nif3-like dinuclear metal center hexameric protein [Firmicutes bacterium]|nr:Nif3-like dinuclear metal center hexameric protein [Bacillota bacterium]
MLVKDVVNAVEKLAPPELAEHWDNVGLLIGDEKKPCKRVLFALDAIDAVIDEAIEEKADMIVTHHPIIFKGVSSVNTKTALGRRIIKLVKNDIAVYCAHTSLDIAAGGTNDILADTLKLKNKEGLIPLENGFMGRTGSLDTPVSLREFTQNVIETLGMPSVNVTGDENTVIKKIGLCTGSGADRDFMLAAKKAGCDVYITGDVKYHDAQFADDIGICLIDATHFYTETIAMPIVCDLVKNETGLDCFVTKIKGESFKNIRG